MTEVLHSPSSSSPSSISTQTSNGTFFQTQSSFIEEVGFSGITRGEAEEEEEEEEVEVKGRNKDRDQLSLLALLVTLFRKSFWVTCRTDREGLSCRGGNSGMDIGWPTNVRHVAHVTFDRFNGFLGLPSEFEPEVPRRAPSASATCFGVSTESMQLSFDSRGNSVPTILLLMQSRLYAQGGLQAEGIFRINAENSQEEFVRDQLNRGLVPEGIDVHCLAGLIKAWFRELPRGVLDPLSQEQVIQCQSEDDCTALVRILPPTEAALLDWAINLMADVVQEEHINKMNARNIAMVFAPNMTQMADPLTALRYAVQVMNFLKTLIEKTLRERKDSVVEPPFVSDLDPLDENGQQNSSKIFLEENVQSIEVAEQVFSSEEPISDSASDCNQVDNITDEEYLSYSTSTYESDASGSCDTPLHLMTTARETLFIDHSNLDKNTQRNKMSSDCDKAQSTDKTVVEAHGNGDKVTNDSDKGKGIGKLDLQQHIVQALGSDGKNKGISNLSRINSLTERIEAWR